MLATTSFAQNPPVNDHCEDAIDLDALFHNDEGVTFTSDIFTNVDATVGDDYPVFGLDCWLEVEIMGDDEDPREQTIWFTFVGDGLEFNILTSDCDGTAKNYIFGGDTQLAIFTGDCGDFTEVVACNEDSENIPNQPGWNDWYAEVDFLTEIGQLYYLLIDGLDWDVFGYNEGIAEGEFCFEISQGTPSVIVERELEVSFFPNPVSDLLQVNCEDNIDGLNIYDINGKLILQDQPNLAQVQLDLSTLTAGVYQIVFYSDAKMSTQKLMIE